MDMALTNDQKASFFKDGYIVVRNLLSQPEIETLRQRYAALATGEVPGYPQKHVSVREVEGRASYGRSQGPRAMEEVVTQSPRHDRRGTQIYPKGEEDYIDERQAPVDDPVDAVAKQAILQSDRPVVIRHDPLVSGRSDQLNLGPRSVEGLHVEDVFGKLVASVTAR